MVTRLRKGWLPGWGSTGSLSDMSIVGPCPHPPQQKGVGLQQPVTTKALKVIQMHTV